MLNTQISDAVRAPGKAEADVPLLAARRTLQQTTRLVNQFLTLSAAEAYVAVMTPTSTQDCCDILQKVMEDMAPQAHQKDIDLGFERSGTDTVVPVDPAALHEIMVNLIDNAIRYTQAGGVVTVRLNSIVDRISVSIEDNGPGIPEQSRGRIFERFYRAADTGTTGSGLGLAIVKELVSQCGGTVQLQAPGHGDHGLLVELEFSASRQSG